MSVLVPDRADCSACWLSLCSVHGSTPWPPRGDQAKAAAAARRACPGCGRRAAMRRAGMVRLTDGVELESCRWCGFVRGEVAA